MFALLGKLFLGTCLVVGTFFILGYIVSVVFAMKNYDELNDWFTGKGFHFTIFNWTLLFLIIVLFHPEYLDKN